MEVNQPGAGVPPQTPPQGPGNNSAQSNQTLMGILAYLGILIIIPFLTESRHDPFVKFHLKQGLVLFIAEVIASVILKITIIGWILSPLIGIVSLILLIMGISNVLNKRMAELPLIGHWANKFDF